MQGRESVAPGRTCESVAPGRTCESVAPGGACESVAPGGAWESVAPGGVYVSVYCMWYSNRQNFAYDAGECATTVIKVIKKTITPLL